MKCEFLSDMILKITCSENYVCSMLSRRLFNSLVKISNFATVISVFAVILTITMSTAFCHHATVTLFLNRSLLTASHSFPSCCCSRPVLLQLLLVLHCQPLIFYPVQYSLDILIQHPTADTCNVSRFPVYKQPQLIWFDEVVRLL